MKGNKDFLANQNASKPTNEEKKIKLTDIEVKQPMVRMLTQEELDKQDLFFCHGDDKISLRNLLKVLNQISNKDFEIAIKEMVKERIINIK